MRILFFAEVTSLAHFMRPLVIAKALKEEGHDILFLTTNKEFVPLDQLKDIPHDFLKSPVTPAVFREAIETAGHPYTKEILDDYLSQDLSFIESFKPDLIVGDMRLSLYVASAKTKIPFINISNSYWDSSAIIPTRLPVKRNSSLKDTKINRFFGKLLKPLIMNHFAKPFNAFAKGHGVPAYGNYTDVLTKGTYTLYCDDGDLLRFTSDLAGKKIMGPLLYDMDMPLPEELSKPREKKRIFLSLGSSGPHSVLKDLVEVLKDLDVEVVLCSTVDLDRSGLGEKFKIYKFLPYQKASAISDLVVCNGGSSIVYSSLVSGVPALMIPLNFDQVVFSSIAEENGLGLVLRFDEFTKTNFKKAVEKALQDQRMKENALAFKERIKNVDPLKNIVQYISGLSAP